MLSLRFMMFRILILLSLEVCLDFVFVKNGWFKKRTNTKKFTGNCIFVHIDVFRSEAKAKDQANLTKADLYVVVTKVNVVEENPKSGSMTPVQPITSALIGRCLAPIKRACLMPS